MKAPPRLQSLIEEGLIDTVVRQLMSGKEAMVYVVRCGDETRCAKVYKEATQRSFRQAVDYTENRKAKNSRQARAMAKGTRFGRQAQEAAWQSAEVDALYRLAAAGVRVPKPYNFHDGVLLMELVADENGDAAPRLNDVVFTAEAGARASRDPAGGGGAHAVRRRRARRPVGVQHPAGRRRPGDHRSAAGGGCRGQQPRQAHAAARRGQPARLLRPLRAGAAATPSTGTRSGTCTKRGVLQPGHGADRPLRAHDRRRWIWASVMREIDDARAEEAARRLRMQ